jgi:hypothetical protein
MCIKNALTALVLFFPFFVSSQIKIIDIGDGWKAKVESAIEVVRKYDYPKYKVLLEQCNQIDFGLASFATSDGKSTIILPVEVLNRGCINDIAACLVHESYHMQLNKFQIDLDENYEEVMCYEWELKFLEKIPNVENWLIENSKYQINVYLKK